MLEILASSFGIATRADTRPSREKLAEQRRWEEERFYQGRRSPPPRTLHRL